MGVVSGVTDFAVAGAELGAAGGALGGEVFGSEVFGSAAGAGFGGVAGVALCFLYEFTAVAGGADFSADGSDFCSASGFFAESVMLIETT